MVLGTHINATTTGFISLNDAATEVFDIMAWSPTDGLKHLIGKPVGVVHRAADGSFAEKTTGWKSKNSFREGLEKTIKWYEETKDPAQVRKDLESLLWDRKKET